MQQCKELEYRAIKKVGVQNNAGIKNIEQCRDYEYRGMCNNAATGSTEQCTGMQGRGVESNVGTVGTEQCMAWGYKSVQGLGVKRNAGSREQNKDWGTEQCRDLE